MASGSHGILTPLDSLRTTAARLGFASLGVTDLSPPPHGDALDDWLATGRWGTMGYMPRQAAKRKDPSRIVPGATRAIVVTRTYTPDDPSPTPPGHGRVASYARGPDYHDTLQAPLEALVDAVRALGDGATIAKAYVDAGPVPERELAQRAGLGWIGKNTMLIDPDRGSFFFIATVFTNLDLPVTPPFEADRCGSCRACLDACPTSAFPAPRVLDANRCISYLTIEYKGDIPPELGAELNGWIFGCDICQSVCPWNIKFAHTVEDDVLGLSPAYGTIECDDLLRMNEEEFDRQFGHTPLARPGLKGMVRNARALAGGGKD